ncbi:MAG: dihydroorotase, partial [Usitatibacteraceae bacterium]
GAAGCFSALHALELYATAFESVGKLDQLEGFASFFGADFYGLPRNQSQVTLKRETWTIPDELPFTESGLVPLHAGEALAWKMV